MRDDRSGQQFGEYVLTKRLGSGTFGAVYLAEQTFSKEVVAVKIMYQTPNKSNFAEFLSEARGFRIVHPNIVHIRDFGIEQDILFLVMDYMPNGNLRTRHPKGSQVPWEIVSSYAAQIAQALQAIHDRGIVHRDVKPENLLVGADEKILLSDFGIAVPSYTWDPSRNQMPKGTPNYMAPEQLNGMAVRESDQYSLGIVMYELLTGSPPFTGSLEEVLGKQQIETPASLRRIVPTIQSEAEQIVLRMIAKNPQERFASMREFEAALVHIQELSGESSVNSTTATESKDSFREQPGTDHVILVPSLTRDNPVEQPIAITEPAAQTPGKPPVPSTQLIPDDVVSQYTPKDFFILYNMADFKWAKWVAWELEEAGFQVEFPGWSLHSTSDFTLDLKEAYKKARRAILLISPDCLDALHIQPDFIPSLKQEVATKQSKLLPICVRDCSAAYSKLLNSIKYINFAGETEELCHDILFAEIKNEGIKLRSRPAFPTAVDHKIVTSEPTFPGEIHSTVSRSTVISEDNKSINQTIFDPAHPVQNIKIFISYSHEDENYRKNIEEYLVLLKRASPTRSWKIESWYDSEIGAGTVYKDVILKQLREAHIILLLISQKFMASEYCYTVEVQTALERHKAGKARVIPIILSSATWQDSPIGELLALPKDGLPISYWRSRGKAYLNIYDGIQKEIERLVAGF